MNATSPAASRPDVHEAPHEEREVFLRLFVGPQDGHYVAISADYAIVAMGDTFRGAVEQLYELVHDYLDDCGRDGKSPEEAIRPISLRWRAQLHGRVLCGRIIRRLRPARPETQELEVWVPRHLEGLAGC